MRRGNITEIAELSEQTLAATGAYAGSIQCEKSLFLLHSGVSAA